MEAAAAVEDTRLCTLGVAVAADAAAAVPAADTCVPPMPVKFMVESVKTVEPVSSRALKTIEAVEPPESVTVKSPYCWVCVVPEAGNILS